MTTETTTTGRPQIGPELIDATLAYCLPKSLRNRIREDATRQGITVSEWHRRLVDAHFAKQEASQ